MDINNTATAKRRDKSRLVFDNIPQPNGGEVALSIRPPGTWFDNADYIAFVGGCGVGSVSTLKEARKILHSKAVEYCDERIRESESRISHYKSQRSRLVSRGLTGERKEKVS